MIKGFDIRKDLDLQGGGRHSAVFCAMYKCTHLHLPVHMYMSTYIDVMYIDMCMTCNPYAHPDLYILNLCLEL